MVTQPAKQKGEPVKFRLVTAKSTLCTLWVRVPFHDIFVDRSMVDQQKSQPVKNKYKKLKIVVDIPSKYDIYNT